MGRTPPASPRRRSTRSTRRADVDMGAMKVNIEEDQWGKWEYDEDHDGEFDPKLHKEARLEEVNFMQNIGVWEPSTGEECMQKTGKAPITTKWSTSTRAATGRC